MTVAMELFKDSDKKQKLNTGQIIFEAGEPGDTMYVVLDGQIEVVANGQVVNTVDPGDVFGEMALIDNRPRSADARAAKPSVIVPVDKFNFIYYIEHSPLFALEVMSTMAERLRGKIA